MYKNMLKYLRIKVEAFCYYQYRNSTPISYLYDIIFILLQSLSTSLIEIKIDT